MFVCFPCPRLIALMSLVLHWAVHLSQFLRREASAFKKTYDYLQKFSALHDPENVHAATVCANFLSTTKFHQNIPSRLNIW
jgi:hypothetical protein